MIMRIKIKLMTEMILYFLAGAGAVCLSALVWTTARLLRKEKSFGDVDLSVKNLRRQCRLLEQMCDANRVASTVQMETIVSLAKQMKGINERTSTIWEKVQELLDEQQRKNDTSPE